MAGRSFEYADLLSNTLGALFCGVVIQRNKLTPYIRKLGVLVIVVAIAGIIYYSYTKQKHFNLGMRFEKEKKFLLAREQYVLALQNGAESGNLYNAIAWLDMEFLDGDAQEAYRYAAKAVEKDLNNPDYLDTYGWALYNVGRTKEALLVLQRAYAMKPEI